MIISDLNYLEDASQEVFGAKGFTTTTNVKLVGSATTTDTLNVTKTITLSLGGIPAGSNTAELTANVDATGNTTYAGAVTSVQADPGKSGVFISGIAVSI